MTGRKAGFDGYPFRESLVDLRDSPDEAEPLRRELVRESAAGHELHGRVARILARALPQDDVLVALDDGFALVHLAWSGRPEPLPWPSFVRVSSTEQPEKLGAEALLSDGQWGIGRRGRRSSRSYRYASMARATSLAERVSDNASR